MQTQPGGTPATPDLLVPPCSVEFAVFQTHKNRAVLHVRVASGKHVITCRQLEFFYDAFGEIPVIVLDSCMRWILWLGQFEAERRLADPAQRRQLRIPFPGWPAPDNHRKGIDDVEF